MFFTPVIRRSVYMPAIRSAEQFLNDTLIASTRKAAQVGCSVEQDENSYALSFDVPGVSREQLTIGIEGNVVRIETKAEANRHYKAAYELPQDIDVTASEAKLEHGVLTLRLAKKLPQNAVTELTIN